MILRKGGVTVLKVNRRQFLALAGTASLMTLFGCNGRTETNEKKTMISILALKSYELLTCQNDKMLVRYTQEAQTFTVIKLENIDDSLEETDIFQSTVIEPNDGLKDFYNQYQVINTVPADQAFSEVYGTKNYYTIEEVDEITDKKSYQKTK